MMIQELKSKPSMFLMELLVLVVMTAGLVGLWTLMSGLPGDTDVTRTVVLAGVFGFTIMLMTIGFLVMSWGHERDVTPYKGIFAGSVAATVMLYCVLGFVALTMWFCLNVLS